MGMTTARFVQAYHYAHGDGSHLFVGQVLMADINQSKFSRNDLFQLLLEWSERSDPQVRTDDIVKTKLLEGFTWFVTLS